MKYILLPIALFAIIVAAILASQAINSHVATNKEHAAFCDDFDYAKDSTEDYLRYNRECLKDAYGHGTSSTSGEDADLAELTAMTDEYSASIIHDSARAIGAARAARR